MFSRIAKKSIILKFAPTQVLTWSWTSICFCNSGCRVCCLKVFNLSLNIVCVCLTYSSSLLRITTYVEFLLSQLNGTLISNFLLTILKVCSVPSLKHCNRKKVFAQIFTPSSELLGEKELLPNIPQRFVLVAWVNKFDFFLMRFSFDLKPLSFPTFV